MGARSGDPCPSSYQNMYNGDKQSHQFLIYSYESIEAIRIDCSRVINSSFKPQTFISMSSSRKVQITIVSREAGEIIDDVIDSILDNIIGVKPQTMEVESPDIFQSLNSNTEHHYYPSYDLYQVKCYQQHVGNFCGYHATFAYVCILQILENVKDCYHLNSGASFWTFKKKIETFLFEYRKQKKLDTTAWPWRDSDILYGDFQRTYNQVLKSNSDIFLDFTTNEVFELIESNWEYQYKNLVCDQNYRMKLAKKIEYFVNYRKEKPLIFVMMLGITNHWTCFVGAKVKDKTQFWFIDSKNREFLDFSVSEISVLLNAFELKRIEEGYPAWQKYQKQIYEQAMVDTQISLKLIVQLLKGEQNIHQYHYNRMFEIFSQKYEEFMKEQRDTYTKELANWVTEYKHNLRGFFMNKVDVQSLYEANRGTYTDMVKNILKYEKQTRDLGVVANYIRGSGNL